MDGVRDSEQGVLYKTDNLSPFLHCEINIPKYKKQGARIEVEFNPLYISYMEKQLVYLDFNVADLYKKIPPSDGDSRRAVFTLSKLHNVGQQKGSREIVIDTSKGHMFAEVFQLARMSKKKEADIQRIFTPIKEKLGYISDFRYHPKENQLVCIKGKKVV